MRKCVQTFDWYIQVSSKYSRSEFSKKKKVYYKNNMYVKNIHIFIMCVFLYLIMLNTKMILLFEQSQQVQNNDIYKPQVAGHF